MMVHTLLGMYEQKAHHVKIRSEHLTTPCTPDSEGQAGQECRVWCQVGPFTHGWVHDQG